MLKNNNITRAFKQKKVPFLGEFLESLLTALPAVSIFSYISTTIVLYETTKVYIIEAIPWINIWYFLLVLVAAFIPVIFLVYKYVIPSVWHFRSTQMGHIEKKLDALTEKLDELNGRLNENSRN